MKQRELIGARSSWLFDTATPLEATGFELAIEGFVTVEAERMTPTEPITGKPLAGDDQNFGHRPALPKMRRSLAQAIITPWLNTFTR